MNILTTIFIAIAITGTVSNAAYLRIIEADVPGGNWGHGPMLVEETQVCPSTGFPKFTVECVQDGSGLPKATHADFYLDGQMYMKDSMAPFVLTGDNDHIAKPWINYPKKVTIDCMLSNGESAAAVVTFDCGIGSAIMEPAPLPSPEMLTVSKATSSTPNEPSVCLKIPTTKYDFRSGPWVAVGSAMGYKYEEYSRKTDRSGTSKLVYRFVAPATSQYAFTLDWETNGKTDYNDVWVDFPSGGWTLKRRDSTKLVRGWVKAYQNAKERTIAAYSVDFNPHSISTTLVLQKGQTYLVKLGGRSTRVKVFSIIMFPCEGDQCFNGPYWNNAVKKCSA